MGARPVFEVSDRLYIVRAAFSRSPDAHNFDSCTRRLPQGLRQLRAIVAAIHPRDICADEPKRTAIDHEATTFTLHESGPSAASVAAPTGNHKQKCRARNQCQRGYEQ